MFDRALVCASVILAIRITSGLAQETPPQTVPLAAVEAAEQPRSATAAGAETGRPDANESSQYAPLAEDMEILGRLVHSSVQSLYAAEAWQQVAEDHKQFGVSEDAFRRFHGWSTETSPADDRVSAPQSTWLPGYGLAIQLEAPLPAKPQEPDSAAAGSQQPKSPWERLQSELRGEAVPDIKSSACATCHVSTASTTGSQPQYGLLGLNRVQQMPPAQGSMTARGLAIMRLNLAQQAAPTEQELADCLILLLAENGKYLRLSDLEQVAISVTFRPSSNADKQTDASAASETKVVSSNWPVPFSVTVPAMSSTPTSPPLLFTATPGSPDSAAQAGAAGDEAADDSSRSDDSAAGNATFYLGRFYGRPGSNAVRKSNEEVQGDLHLRQGDFAKAVSSYGDAFSPALKDHFRTRSARRIDWKQVGEHATDADYRIIAKLSQALVGKGELDKAERLIQLLRERASRASGQPHEQAEGADASRMLPARMILSARKADLDDVAAGRIGIEDFKRRVFYRFFAPTKAGAGSESQETAIIRRDEPVPNP